MSTHCGGILGTISCNVAGAAAGAVAGSVFDAAVNRLAEGFADALRMVVTFCTGVPVQGLSATDGPVAQLRANTAWLTAFIAVLSLLVCAGRMALTRSSRPAGEAFKGLLILVVASGCGVAAINALVVFGDSYSVWILDRSTGGQLGARMATFGLVASTLSPGLLIILALLGIMASVGQLGMMLVRVGVVTIFAGLLPLAAAGTSTQTGMEYFKRITSWLLAFVLYKPVAATIYAAAFLMMGDGKDPTSVLSGICVLILSVLALPAMLRLITPMVGAAVAAGTGSSGGLEIAGRVVATGARMSAGSGRPSPAAGGSGQAGLQPGGARPPTGGGAGMSGAAMSGGARSAGARSAGAGAGAAGAGAGAAGSAAGAAGAAAQAGARAARGAASNSTAGTEGTPPTPPSGAPR